MANWVYKALGMALVGAVVLIFVLIIWPERLPPPPPGWSVWQEPGATRGLALTEGGVYSGSARGLFLLNKDGTTTRIDIPGISGSVFVNALLVDEVGTLWVAHNQGLSIRTASAWKTLSEADGLPHRRVAGMAVAKDGFVWLGTEKGAVRMPMNGPWKPSTMRRLTTHDGLLHDSVYAMAEDREGGLWFGNYAAPAGGLSRLAGGRWSHWTPKEGLPHPNVTSLMVASDGRVWAGCGLLHRGGAAVFSGASGKWKLERIVAPDELAGPKVRSLYQDGQGRVWVGSEFDGLAVRHGEKTIRIVKPEEGLLAGEVMVIAEARDKAIWLGTQGGVMRISSDAVASLFVGGLGVGESGNP